MNPFIRGHHPSAHTAVLSPSSIKEKFARKGRSLLLGTPLFIPVRSLYQRIFDPKKQQFWDHMLDFYGSFISSGDLVFDVGANVGVYTDVFLKLGATIVAVEPNPDCCEEIRRTTHSKGRVIVEVCAAGAVSGISDFHICEESTMSTLSERWLESVSKSELHKHAKWLNTVQVPIRTLDSLAKQYGKPAFIKIDTEGFDDQVLAGMSFRPPVLSFEFNLNVLDVAQRCLETPALVDGYVFNYTIGQAFHYGSEAWLTRREMAAVLENFSPQEEYGEIFARVSL